MGSRYYNGERFKALIGAGKPLWEFKEFDHRIYCYRKCDGEAVTIVLLNGWEKQNKGKDKREANEVARAQEFLAEYLKGRKT